MIRSPYALLAACGVLLLAAGCSQPALDPAVVAAHRTRLELAEEPDGAQTVLEVRQIMYGEDPADGESDGEPASAGGGATEDHADHAHAEGEHADHDHDHADHDHAHDAGDDAEDSESVSVDGDAKDEHADHDHAEGEEHADHDHGHADHDHAAHDEDHADHDHAAHEDHDHDGDGVQDHAPEDHIAETTKKEPVLSELDVVLVGSVGGVANPSDQSHPEFPFAKGKAIFFLADPAAVAEMEEHEHKHAPGEECAFCAAHAGESAHMLAVIQFNDEKGKTIPVDARELFELKEKETVVVRGKAKVDPSGMLVVDADGLYVRR
jgi:hypothetical protein